MIAGVDGCRNKWIAAVGQVEGRTSVRPFDSFGELVACEDFELIVIDVPIGLVDTGKRAADVAAREFLARRACCVFTSPIRPILDCANREAADAEWRRIDGRGCPAQCWGIVRYINDVDNALRKTPSLQGRVREGHPEVSFAVMNDGEAIPIRKRNTAGQEQRLRLLRRFFGSDVDRALKGRPQYTHTDIIDAYSMLWTARRIHEGLYAVRFPAEEEPPDSYGLKMEIIA